MSREKTSRCSLRFTPSEKENLKEKAKQSRMTMSEYILALSEQKRIIVADGIPELTLAITRIGVNVNQIAAVANAQKNVPEYQLQKVETALVNVREQLSLIIKMMYATEDNIEV